MKVQYLVHSETKREFRVVGLENGEITLKGPNTEFKEPFDKDRFKANGYTLVTREEEPEPEAEEEAPAEEDEE